MVLTRVKTNDWYAFVVQCTNCPGLTNAEIDRTTVPYRARLRVGPLPQAIKVEPSRV
jgi:hypothetical protein